MSFTARFNSSSKFDLIFFLESFNLKNEIDGNNQIFN